MYLDEASIVNGRNGESILLVVIPQVVQELVPQANSITTTILGTPG